MLKFKRINVNDRVQINFVYDHFTMRQADIQELQAATGIETPMAALKCAIEHSTEWTEMCFEDTTLEIIAIFGLRINKGLKYNVGIPWMVASSSINNYKKLLMKYSRVQIADMFENVSLLCNYVDIRNTQHIRWLKHMGFTVFDKPSFTMRGTSFKYFYKYKNKENK